MGPTSFRERYLPSVVSPQPRPAPPCHEVVAIRNNHNVTFAMSLGADDNGYRVRVLPLEIHPREASPDGVGTVYRPLIGQSRDVLIQNVVWPIDYRRGVQGIVIYTTPDDVDELASKKARR